MRYFENYFINSNGGPSVKIPLNAVADLSVAGGNEQATIKRTDPGNLTVNGVLLTSRISSKLVRKEGSAPTDSTDGDLILTETTENTYSSTGYIDTGLTVGTTYYYAVFVVGDNGLETKSNVESATIGGGGGWQPGANTMLYLPMETDLLDHSGNSLTVNNIGSVSLANVGLSFSVAQFNSTSTELTFAYQGNINNAWTISFWENIENQNTHAQFITAGTWSRHSLFQLGYTDSPSRGLTLSNYGDDVNLGSYAGRDGSWHLITATYSGVAGQTNNAKVYIDGSLAMQGTMQGRSWQTNTFMIGNYNQETSMGGFLSKFIIETAERTAQEITDYYDLTKGDYGIS